MEDLLDNIKKNGKERAFKILYGDENMQRWYYSSVYNSCIYGVDENNEIFKRYKEILERIF